MLNSEQYRCYVSERDILSMASLRHPGIVEFRGCREEHIPGGAIRYLIVTTYEPVGPLIDYLKNHTVDWTTACKMFHSLATGVAFLHTESPDGGSGLIRMMVVFS